MFITFRSGDEIVDFPVSRDDLISRIRAALRNKDVTEVV